MKRSVPITGLMALAALLSAAAAIADEQLEAVRARVSETFKEIDPQHVNPSPIEGWYTVQKGAVVAYISADGRYLMQGDLIDLERSVNLSEESRNEARLEMLASLPKDQQIVFSPEQVKYSVAVFTDIDCTFCRRLHAEIEGYMAAGIEVRYLLYPRSGPTSQSWAKAERVWCSDDRNKALTLAKLDEEFQSRDCDASIVSSHYSIGHDVGLRGTPAIVLEDGQLVSGYLPPEQLTQALVAASAE